MKKIAEVLEQLKKMKPKALILFGSAARGEMKKDSDVDVLMVKETKKISMIELLMYIFDLKLIFQPM